MAADIVPELYKDIVDDFEKAVENQKMIGKFLSKLEKETATAEDVAIYASNLGMCAARALLGNLTEARLPDGKMYWNIADRTIKPLLQKVNDLIMDAAIRQQTYERKKKGIGLKAMPVDFPEDRVNDLMYKLADIFDEEIMNE